MPKLDCGDILAPWGIPKGARLFHPPRDICMQMNTSTEMNMHALFTYTADAIHRRGGGVRYSTISAQHRVAAIRLIKERVESQSSGPDDNTILAVIGLVASVCENRAFHISADQEHEMLLHVQGLRAMVAARGGISPNLYDPRVYWLLYW